MNHKKSMRIFWLSLCLLVVSGTIIIAAVQYQSHKKEIKDWYEKQDHDGQAGRMAQTEADSEDANADTPASHMPQPGTSRENTSADTQTQPVSGNTAEYRFELKVKDGYLDVYHYHTENLFFHTGIPYSATTLNQRKELEAGKYFLNEQELYGYLESCTS